MTPADPIVIVDDDPLMRTLVRETLKLDGFSVLEAGNGDELDLILARQTVSLIILDISLPGADGFSIMRRLRERISVPVIMLTAKSDVVDRVVGLELGADDYICKPVEMRELVARIRTVLRRLQPPAPNPNNEGSLTGTRRFGNNVLDLSRRQLRGDSGDEIRLTSGEFDLI